MLVGVFKTWEWALQNGWHHRLLYRNVICARVCSPVLKRTRVYRLLSNITVVLALCHCLAPLYQVGEGETTVMVRMTYTKDILWQFFCGNDSLVQENKAIYKFVRFEVLTLVLMKIPVFWYWNDTMKTCTWQVQMFLRPCCVHLQGSRRRSKLLQHVGTH